MAMGGGGTGGAVSEINVTPLIDVLLAYALTQQHYWMGCEDGWMKILQEHGWNGDRSTALAAMGDLQSRALEAAKEAG